MLQGNLLSAKRNQSLFARRDLELSRGEKLDRARNLGMFASCVDRYCGIQCIPPMKDHQTGGSLIFSPVSFALLLLSRLRRSPFTRPAEGTNPYPEILYHKPGYESNKLSVTGFLMDPVTCLYPCRTFVYFRLGSLDFPTYFHLSLTVHFTSHMISLASRLIKRPQLLDALFPK